MYKNLFVPLSVIVFLVGCGQGHVVQEGALLEMTHKSPMLMSKMKLSQTSAKAHSVNANSSYLVPMNTERYDSIKENDFKLSKASPLSTLSIDVDTASYTNILRMIEDENRMPVKGSVRIEEMVNYFSYNYPQPVKKSKHPFTITTEVNSAPWNTKNKLLLVGLQAQRIEKSQLPRSNFVALVDVSGSMSRSLGLVKQTLKLLARKLDKNDRLSIVNYATNIGVTLEPTSGDEYETISQAIETLKSYGGTNGEAGIEVAYELARKTFIHKGNNRILMFTDGDFNVGKTSNSEMVSIVEKERKSGVFLSIVGFGRGNYNDSIMEIGRAHV